MEDDAFKTISCSLMSIDLLTKLPMFEPSVTPKLKLKLQSLIHLWAGMLTFN